MNRFIHSLLVRVMGGIRWSHFFVVLFLRPSKSIIKLCFFDGHPVVYRSSPIYVQCTKDLEPSWLLTTAGFVSVWICLGCIPISLKSLCRLANALGEPYKALLVLSELKSSFSYRNFLYLYFLTLHI